MNLENENLKLILGDAELLIETTSKKNDLKTSQRFNKKNLSNAIP